MLNYADVQQLRRQGQSNRQILEMMAPVVPSAAKTLKAIDGDKKTPAWQIDAKIGKMLDSKVPKNAPSGIPYLTAVGLNEAQKSYDDKMGAMEQQAEQVEKQTLLQQLKARNQAAFGTDTGVLGMFGGVNTDSAVGRFATGQQSLPETGLQIAGQSAGAVGDVIGAGLGLAGRGLSAITPDFIERPVVDTVKSGVQAVADSPIGDAISGAAGMYGQFKQANPRMAANVESAGNVASLLPLPKIGSFGLKGAKAGAKAVGLDDTAMKAAQGLRDSADDSIGRVLNPTTKIAKQQTKRISQDLIDRPLSETFAFTRKGMQRKAGEMADVAGEAIDQAGKLQGRTKTSDLLQSIASMKEEFMAGGKVVNQNGVDSVDNVLEILGQYGDEMDDETLRTVRRIFDSEAKAARKLPGATTGEVSKMEMKKVAANKIRGILAEKYPDIAKLNKEYSFWANLDEILSATTTRKTGQKGLVKNLATMAGAVSGEGILDATGKAYLFRAVASLADSPAWGIVSAKLKTKIADALAAFSADDLAKALGTSVDDLTPEERITGLIGGGGDNMPRAGLDDLDDVPLSQLDATGTADAAAAQKMLDAGSSVDDANAAIRAKKQ